MARIENSMRLENPLFNRARKLNRIPLPTYPFRRKRCWLRGDGVS